MRGEKLDRAVNAGKTGLDHIPNAMAFYVDSSHGAEGRQGCLVVGSAAKLPISDDEVARRVAVALDRNEALMAELIQQGQADGSIPVRIDSKATALNRTGIAGCILASKARKGLPSAS